MRMTTCIIKHKDAIMYTFTQITSCSLQCMYFDIHM